MAKVKVKINPLFKKKFENNKRDALEALGIEWQANATHEIDTAGKMLPIRNIVAGGAVDTGEMRASNVFRADPKSDSVLVGNRANHSIYVTMGTWKMPARPWFQRSLTEYNDDYKRALALAMGRGIK